MSDTLKPRDAADVEAAVQAAVAQDKTLEIVGHGTKRAIGRAAQWDLTLDLSGLSGVTLYEPAELVLSAKAGTPLAEIEALLEQNGQQLAFEPMGCGLIFGDSRGRGTIGGALAANLSGPRRIKAGAARDHFLGFAAVSGRGETFKSGGRVVKNVTGYDLSKLMAGSWGTLAVMTDVTVKVLPKPETELTVVMVGIGAADAVKAMSVAMASPCEVSAAAHTPHGRGAAGLSPEHAAAGYGQTCLRLEGVGPSVMHRRQMLEAMMKPFGPTQILEEKDSQYLWRCLRDAGRALSHAPRGDRVLWRVSVAPTKGAEVGALVNARSEANMFYDWAGGLVWIELPSSDDAGAALVRAAVAKCGGHATLVRAPASVRASVEVFQPHDPVLAALSKRVKESFDPRGVLNPGRMYAGV
jgi:glycolate oxidase FAD binding subunit